MTIDYNDLAKKYDLTRIANTDIVIRLIEGARLNEKSTVVDFGCGTGNFTIAIKKLTNARVYGIEPSDGMREKAVLKESGISFRKGDHSAIPLEDGCADLIYMTDVIHHVPDTNQMFAEFYRVLKSGGIAVVVTESYVQLETRFWVKYFPSTAEVEKSRYPDIGEIINTAAESGFSLMRADTTDMEAKHTVSGDFVKLVENKGYSMFDLISEEDYQKGLEMLKGDFNERAVLSYTHGETLIWLAKT